MNTKRIVITGGPSVGKTSLINTLKDRNYNCFPEVIREFTKEEAGKKTEESLKSNPIVFADDSMSFNRKLIEGRARQFHEGQEMEGDFAFYDRGLPDILAYMDLFGQTYGSDFTTICRELRYDMVFILPPWREIYATDEGRFETYEEGIQLYEHLSSRYQSFDYEPIVVPKTTVPERIDFMLNILKKNFE